MRSRLDDRGSRLLDAGGVVATDEIFGLVYEELRALAARHLERERVGHTLAATAVVHELYLRISRQEKASWTNRAQFLAIASRMIRRVLVDHARRRNARKRGDGVRPSPGGQESGRCLAGDCDVAELDDALDVLAGWNPRQAKVVELRYFGGLSIEETADVLAVSPGTVKADWRLARAWLAARLG